MKSLCEVNIAKRLDALLIAIFHAFSCSHEATGVFSVVMSRLSLGKIHNLNMIGFSRRFEHLLCGHAVTHLENVQIRTSEVCQFKVNQIFCQQARHHQVNFFN